MPGVRIKIRSRTRLQSAFPEMEARVSDFQGRLAENISRALLDEMARLTPVDTQALADSEHSEVMDESPWRTVYEVRTEGSNWEHLARLGRDPHGPDYSYALYVHEGMGPGTRSPQPYMTDAVDAVWARLGEIAHRAWGEVIV